MTTQNVHARHVRGLVAVALRHCLKRGLIDRAKVEAAQDAVTARLLAGYFADPAADPSSVRAVQLVEQEVEVEAVPEVHFLQLAALRHAGPFAHGVEAKVKVVFGAAPGGGTGWGPRPDGPGTEAVCPTLRLEEFFPFSRVTAAAGPGMAVVSEDGVALLRAYLRTRPGAKAAYDLLAPPSSEAGRWPPPLATWNAPGQLPPGWGLDDKTPAR